MNPELSSITYMLGRTRNWNWRGDFVLEGGNPFTPTFLIQPLNGEPIVNGQDARPALLFIRGASHEIAATGGSDFSFLLPNAAVLAGISGSYPISASGGTILFTPSGSCPSFLVYSTMGATGAAYVLGPNDYVLYRNKDVVRNPADGHMYMATRDTFGQYPHDANSDFTPLSLPIVVDGGEF